MIDLEEILREIGGASEDARFAAWMRLYNSTDKEAKGEITRVIEGKDPILKILFSRFLSNVYEEKAVGFLSDLLQEENRVVVEAAKKGFEKNKFGQKLHLLLPLTDSPSEAARFFAIEKLALGGVEQLVDRLLPRLRGAEGESLVRLLAALRHFPGRRVVECTIPFLKDSREEVRFRSVLVLGACYEAGFSSLRKPLVRALSDTSSRIRQAVLWCLRKRPKAKDLTTLFSLSISDPDPFVRQESLIEMSSFPTPAVIRHLLTLLVKEKNRAVLLKAEGVLMTMPAAALAPGLKKSLNEKDQNLRNKALVFLAESQRNVPRQYDRILEAFRQATTDRDKLAFIEAFGLLEDLRSVPVLEELLHGPLMTAYIAMGALIRVLRNVKEPPFLNYLKDDRLPVLLKQIVLKEIARRGGDEALSGPMRQLLEQFLQEENINLRYLAAEILVTEGGEALLPLLLTTLLHEKDASMVKQLRRGIRDLIAATPATAVMLLSSCRADPRRSSLVFDLMQDASLSGPEVMSLLPDLLGEPLRILKSVVKERCADLLAPLIVNGSLDLAALLESLALLPDKEMLLPLLTERLTSMPHFEAVLPVSVIREWLSEADPKQKDVMIALMGVCGGRAIVPELVAIASNPSLKRHRAKAIEALQRSLESGS